MDGHLPVRVSIDEQGNVPKVELAPILAFSSQPSGRFRHPNDICTVERFLIE